MSALWSVFGFVAAVGVYAGCTQNFDQFDPTTGSGGSTSSSTTATTGGGGTGGAGECSDTDPCAAPKNLCDTVKCVERKCVSGFAGTKTTCSLKAGGTGFCDGEGSCGECNSPSDCTSETPVCNAPTCEGHKCGKKAIGTDPNCTGGLLHCVGGSCIGCTQPSDCMVNDCQTPTCSPGGMCGHDNAAAGTACASGAKVCDTATPQSNCVPCYQGNTTKCPNPATDKCVSEMCCTPKTATQVCGTQCSGMVDDGCGGMVDCSGNSCGNGMECGSTGMCCSTPSIGTVCGTTCSGNKNDSCGVSRDCGGNICTLPQTCGGGSMANQCGCTKKTVAAACGTQCDGMADDGCGGMIGCDTTICAAGSKNCVDHVCCSTAMCPTCQTCDGSSPGTCSVIAQNSQDNGSCDDTHGGCQGTNEKCSCDGTPNGATACKDKLGQTCTLADGSECASGKCTGTPKTCTP